MIIQENLTSQKEIFVKKGIKFAEKMVILGQENSKVIVIEIK